MEELFNKRISLGEFGEKGWRDAAWSSSSGHIGARSVENKTPLLTLVHLSDTHICDAQSPARLAFTDRFGDPHHPLHSLIGGPVGNYRSNEALTTQVMKTMIDTINRLSAPVSGATPDLVVITGDLTDNAQKNELNWVKALLNGGQVVPNSGKASVFQGPGGEPFSVHYWNPETKAEPDNPHALYGFPKVPGLLSAAVDSFESSGLHVPYLAVHGNHDLMLQGTVLPDPKLSELVISERYPIDLGPYYDLELLAKEFSPFGPTSWPKLEDMASIEVQSDGERAFVDSSTFSNVFDRAALFHAQFIKGFLLISLDTVNENGGWDGSISEEQLTWLEATLNDNASIPTIILSHHPFDRMENLYAKPQAPRRAGGNEVVDVLLRHKNVILWLAGHEHQNRIERIGGANGFWHIETCSLIDWPQQGRVIEIFEEDEDSYKIVTTMFDHQSPDSLVQGGRPVASFDLSSQQHLASLSRQLAGNHWQRRSGPHAVENFEGKATDRNVFLRQPSRG